MLESSCILNNDQSAICDRTGSAAISCSPLGFVGRKVEVNKAFVTVAPPSCVSCCCCCCCMATLEEEGTVVATCTFLELLFLGWCHVMVPFLAFAALACCLRRFFLARRTGSRCFKMSRMVCPTFSRAA